MDYFVASENLNLYKSHLKEAKRLRCEKMLDTSNIQRV